MTVAVWAIVMFVVVVVAVSLTASAVESLTLKVITPLPLDGPPIGPVAPAAEHVVPSLRQIVELLEPPPESVCASVTDLPLTGLPRESFRVTVTVEKVEPSAVTAAGDAVTVEVVGSTTEKRTLAVCVIVVLSLESVAV